MVSPFFNQRMMTSSNGNIFRVTVPLCWEFTGPGEFPTQRPVTRSFDGFFNLGLNKRLSEQPWNWWFETPSWSLWRQCNGCLNRLFPRSRLRHRWCTVQSFSRGDFSAVEGTAKCTSISVKLALCIFWYISYKTAYSLRQSLPPIPKMAT